MPEIGLSDDTIEALVRESVRATVNHWHALEEEAEESSSERDPAEDDDEHKFEEGEALEHNENTVNQDMFGIDNIGEETLLGANEGMDGQEQGAGGDVESEGENVQENIDENTQGNVGENTQENVGETAQENVGETAQENVGETAQEDTESEENLHSVTTRSVEDNEQGVNSAEVDAFIEFAGLMGQIYRGDVMDTVDDNKAMREAMQAGFSRDSVGQFLGQVHGLVSEKEAAGETRQDFVAWKEFMEELKRGRPTSTQSQGSSYTPTPGEVEAFLDLVRYIQHTQGGDPDRVKMTYAEVVEHLMRIRDLSREMSHSDQLSRQEAVQWMDFVAFMQRKGMAVQSHNGSTR